MAEEAGIIGKVVTRLLDKVPKDAVERLFGHRAEVEGGIGLQRPVTKEMESYDRAAVRHDRRTKILDSQKMAMLDPRIGRMFRKLAGDARVGGFRVNVEQATTDAEKDKAQQVIDGLVERCQVIDKLKGWIKPCLRDGDLFWEVVVDEKTKEIARLKKLAAIITFSSMNAEGNFPEGEPAYYQEHPWTREKIKEFEPWQIVQISWDAEDGQPYGTPMFADARLAWERLDNAEKNVVVRRGVRAGMRRHHKVGGNWEEVEEYKKRNRDTLDNPMSAVQDFYSNEGVEIKEMQGDTTLGDMTDVEHFEGQLAMSGGVPMALLGGGREKSINRDVLEEQEEDYLRVVDDINEVFEGGLRKVFNFALLLAGVNDEAVKYTFNWGAKDRDDVDKKIERGKTLQALGFSFTTIFHVCDLDGVTLEEELDRIRKQVEEGIVPYGPGMKLDQGLLMFLAGLGTNAGKEESKIGEQIEKLRELAESQIGPGKSVVRLDKVRHR